MAHADPSAKGFAAFTRAYLREMREPSPARTLDLLAALSHSADFSVGCYCEDESRCHRSLLRELLVQRGARVAEAGGAKLVSMTARALAGLFAMALAGFAVAAEVPPLPDGLADVRDLRAPFRAAFCARLQEGTAACDESLRSFAGEGTAARPAPARPDDYRLLFVPGFLATCFPGIHSFADMIEAARGEGFLDRYARGGRTQRRCREMLASSLNRWTGCLRRIGGSCSSRTPRERPTCWRSSPRAPTSRHGRRVC